MQRRYGCCAYPFAKQPAHPPVRKKDQLTTCNAANGIPKSAPWSRPDLTASLAFQPPYIILIVPVANKLLRYTSTRDPHCVPGTTLPRL